MTKETASTCPYCGVGCGVLIESTHGTITGVRGDPKHPANFGRLCSKGANLHLTASTSVQLQTRLLHPMRRTNRKQKPEIATWDGVLDEMVNQFDRVVRQHGPDAVGFYISGQLLTEDYYVFNKLAKGLIGTNNIDSNSRLCMSSAVAGYKQSLGSDAPPTCYADIAQADCLFIAGSNTAFAHPIVFRRIEDAKAANPELKIIVVDPRRTDTAELADLFLPIQPGTDVMLFNGMLHLMLWEGWVDLDFIAQYTDGFDALKAIVRDCTPELVSQICGIKKDDLHTAAKWFSTSSATLSMYCQGLNQSTSGTAKNTALINLHLATAQIGRVGAGPFSLTGQPNAMGGREVGGMANLLSGHRDLANPDHRAEIEKIWGLERKIPEKAGKTAIELFQAVADGEIKILWIACTNPAQSMPDQNLVRRALQKAELVIVQEAFATTATCEYADILLPATTWGEKDGTVTNSERRISRVRPAVEAPAQTRNDWQIVVDFARRLEEKWAAETVKFITTSLFPYHNAESVWKEHQTTTKNRDLDITGLNYAMLEQQPQQWPMPQGQQQGTERLYLNKEFATPNKKAQFIAKAFHPVAQAKEARYPFALNTGRMRDQWHGMSRTGVIGKLFGHVPEPSIQMNEQDMHRRLLKNGDWVHITSKQGSLLLPVSAGVDVGLSQAFIAMHWGSEFVSGQNSVGETLTGVNALTTSLFCPTSKQPELKHTPIKILKAELPWTLLGMAWLPADVALTQREILKYHMAKFTFATCVPFTHPTDAHKTGLLFRAANHDVPTAEVLLQIESALQLQSTPQSQIMRYADVKKGQHRAVKLTGNADAATLDGFLLAGDSQSTQSQTWIKTVLMQTLPAQSYGRLLLSPTGKAPVAVAFNGNVVCTCFNVTDMQIESQLRNCSGDESQRLSQLQSGLKCGTSCGSCVPQLKRMVKAQRI